MLDDEANDNRLVIRHYPSTSFVQVVFDQGKKIDCPREGLFGGLGRSLGKLEVSTNPQYAYPCQYP